MCQQIVVDGRPGDVASAALGWEQLLKNLDTVKRNLETNVKDLGQVWKGPAYESFKTHIEGIAKSTGRLVEDAENHNGIVQSLRDAADRLTEAQREFPIPASCVNDVLEARNGRIVISAGFFEMKVKPDFLGLLDPISSLADWINDRSEEAAQVYTKVSGQYSTIDSGTPGEVGPTLNRDPDMTTPDLNRDTGTGSTGRVPNIGGKPETGSLGSSPSVGTSGVPSTGSPGIGSGAHPDLSGGYDPGTGNPPGTGGYPGSGSLADDYGSGLAGAGAATTPGLGGGGLSGTTGLGSGGLGGGGLGGGAGGGMIPGGGALGRPVAAGLAPMMGGAEGAGRGGGRGAGGRLGAGGKLGAGGMVPAMG
ncbi:hypothetical protein C1I99_20530, partial [Micromonospora deserti]